MQWYLSLNNDYIHALERHEIDPCVQYRAPADCVSPTCAVLAPRHMRNSKKRVKVRYMKLLSRRRSIRAYSSTTLGAQSRDAAALKMDQKDVIGMCYRCQQHVPANAKCASYSLKGAPDRHLRAQ